MTRAATLRWLDRIAAGLTMLLPPLIIAGPAPADIGASIIAVLFLVRSALLRDASWLRHRWLQWLLLFWVYACVRHAFLPEADGVVRYLVWIRYPMFAAALMHWLLPDPILRHRLIITLTASVMFLVFDTLLQYMRGYDLFGRPTFPYQGGLRLTGPFNGPRVGIVITWLLIPVAMHLLTQPKIIARIAGGMFILLAIVAVFTSGERMALILLGMGLVMAVLLLRYGRVLLLTGLIAGVVASYSMAYSDAQLHARQIETTHQEVGGFARSVYGRTWQSAMRVSVAHPWFGIGSKNFHDECVLPQYGPSETSDDLVQRCPMHPHNIYLELLVEVGVIGLGLFLMALASWARLAIGQWRVWYGDALATGLLIAMVIRLFPISVTTSQFVAWSAVPFWLIAAWLLSYFATAKPRRHNTT